MDTNPATASSAISSCSASSKPLLVKGSPVAPPTTPLRIQIPEWTRIPSLLRLTLPEVPRRRAKRRTYKSWSSLLESSTFGNRPPSTRTFSPYCVWICSLSPRLGTQIQPFHLVSGATALPLNSLLATIAMVAVSLLSLVFRFVMSSPYPTGMYRPLRPASKTLPSWLCTFRHNKMSPLFSLLSAAFNRRFVAKLCF